jgi:putative Holliday junction resolvase
VSLHAALAELPAKGRLLGVDLGDVRIGLAISDGDQLVATAVDTVSAADDVAEQLAAEVVRHGAVGVVVGYPRTMRGREGQAARRARLVAEALAELADVPVALWDERFTTVEAERAMLAQDASRRTRRQAIDRVAATLLLQSVLDARRGGSAWR